VAQCVKFRRRLSPPGIDPARVEASYCSGVLEVHLPRTPEAKARRVEVKA
jgi:HSP20 family molecular chaperone IbpA